MTYIYKCPKCGSENVRIKIWQNPNTGEDDESASILGTADDWCEDCQETVDLIMIMTEDEEEPDYRPDPMELGKRDREEAI